MGVNKKQISYCPEDQYETEEEICSSKMEVLKKIITNYSQSLKKINKRDSMEELVQKLIEKDNEIQELKNEKQSLLEELKGCEDYISNQVDEMKKVAFYIDCLAQKSEQNACVSQSKEKCHDSRQNLHLQTKVKRYKTKLVKERKNNRILMEQLENEKLSRATTEEALSKAENMCSELAEENHNLQCECDMYKKECEKLDQMQISSEIIEEFEMERNCYIEEIQEYQEEIKEKHETIETLTKEILFVKQECKKGESDLQKSILNIQSVQNELETCRKQFSFEKMCMSAHIKELEKQIADYESTMVLKDENNRVLLDTLEREKEAKSKLENAIDRVTKNDDCLKEMLVQAKRTIQCITQQLEEYDIERLETQKHNETKISELQDRLMIADATIKKLRENLDKMKSLMDKNVAMRTLSAQLHESANLQLTELQDANEELSRKNQDVTEMYAHLKKVLYEKDKTFDEFRNQMIALREQLDNEQKLREDTENALADIEAAGDSKLAQLSEVICQQNCEIDRLNSSIQYLQSSGLVGCLRARVNELEVENKELRQEVQNFLAYLKVILPGYTDPKEVALLRKKVKQLSEDMNIQKLEVERQKKIRIETSMQLKTKLDEHEEHYQRIRDLIRENAELKRNRHKNSDSPKVIILEKECKDGKAEYRYLCGTQNEKKKEEPNFEEVNRLKQQLTQANDEIVQLKRKIANQVPNPITKDQDAFNLKTTNTDTTDTKNNEVLNLNINIEESTLGPKMGEELQQAIQEINQLKQALAKHSGVDKACEAEREQLLQEIQAQKKEIGDLLAKINQSFSPNTGNEQMEFVRRENENLKAMIEELRNKSSIECDNLKTTNKELKDTISKLQLSESSLTQKLEDEKARVLELQTAKDDLEKDNEELKNVVREFKKKTFAPSITAVYQKDMDKVDKDMKDWQNSIDNSLQKLTNVMEKLSVNLNKNPEQSTKMLPDMEKVKNEFESAINKKRMSVRLDIKQNYVNELEEQLAQREKEILDLKEKLEQLNKPRTRGHNETSSEIKELEKKLHQSERKVEVLQEELDRMNLQRPSGLSVERSEAELSSRMGNEVDTQLIEELEEKLHAWQQNYDTDIGKLKAEIQLLSQNQPEGSAVNSKSVKDLQTKLEQAELHVGMLEKNIAQLESENERLVTSKFDMKDLSPDDVESERMKKLVEHLRTLEKKNENLKSRIIKLELDNGRLKAELEILTENKEVLGYKDVIQKLRDLEKVSKKCQEKYQVLKRRSMKLEIENKNVKKEYINVLIEKEKHLLQTHEQTRRLRETNKLLKKAQEKKSTLTNRTVKLQVENDNLKKQLDSLITKEMEEHFGRLRSSEDETIIANATLTLENKQLRELVERLSSTADGNDVILPEELREFLKSPKNEDLKFKIMKLELANEKLTEELQTIKSTQLATMDNENDLLDERAAELDLQQIDANQKMHMETVELQIENDYLKHEIENKDKAKQDLEKRIVELEEEIHRREERNENLQRVTVELEVDNECLRNELEKMDKMGSSNHSDHGCKSLEKQNHALKMEIDHLEKEVSDLKAKIGDIGKAEITLETHTQQKLMREIDGLLNEYENIKSGPTRKASSNDLKYVEERLNIWKNLFEPELLDLKRDLDRLRGKDDCAAKFKVYMQESQLKIKQLEVDNQNMRMALEILLKEKGIMTNTKLIEQVEKLMAKYADADTLRKMTTDEDKRIKILTDELETYKEVNDILRNEKVSLESHIQAQRIIELEEALRQKRQDRSHSTDSNPIGRTRSIYDSVDIIKIKQLEEQLKDQQDVNKETLAEVEKLRQEKNLMQADIKSRTTAFQKEIDDLKAEVERYQKVSELQTKMKNDLEKQLQDLRQTSSVIDTKEKEKKVTFGKPQDPEEEIAVIKSEFLKLHEQYEANLEKIKELEEQLKKCQDKNKHYKKLLTVLSPDDDLLKEDASSYHESPKSLEKRKKHSRSHSTDDQASDSEADFQDCEGEFEKYQQMEKELLDARTEIEMMKIVMLRLHKTNMDFRADAERAVKLEESLKETNIKLKNTQFEVQRLRNDYLSLQDRKYRSRFSQLESQLKESQRVNDIYKTKLQILAKQVATEEETAEENKYLKHEINSLAYKLRAYENDNKKLKDDVNQLITVRDDLLKKIDRYTDEISDLQNQLETLESGDGGPLSEELRIKNEENEQLKLVITDLQKQIDLEKQLVGCKGDTDDERVKRLEETLLKYRDNNEFLKTKISNLEAEKITLIMNVHSFSDVMDRPTSGVTEKPPKVVEKQTKNKEKKAAESAEAKTDIESTRIKKIKKEVEKCQAENTNLKTVTAQLEAEIQSLKKDLTTLMNEGKKMRDEKSKKDKKSSRSKEKSNEAVEELKHQKQKWKNVVSKLTEQYQDNINLLKKKLQPSQVLQSARDNILQPWMIQSPLLQAGYTTMPLLVQPMMNYAPVKQEQKTTSSGDGVQQLTEIVDKIKVTLDKSKRAIESEIMKNTEDMFDDEEEEMSLDYESSFHNAQSEMYAQAINNTQTEMSSPSNDVDEKIAELDKQILKQYQAKEKIERLQSDIQETMKNLKELSQKRTRNDVTVAIAGPSTATDSHVRQYYARPTGRSPSMIAHFHGAPSTQKMSKRKCTYVKSSHSKRDNESFDSL